jgi:iron complex outermembrane receptor protein
MNWCGRRHRAVIIAALAVWGVEVAQAQTAATTADTVLVAPLVEVVGSRVPAALPGLVRPVRVVEAAELATAPARSVNEALQAVPGVIVGQRQQYGVQGDLTIRGSTFDQVLVLIDGVAAGDPQTGHHLLDLPLDFADVERLEVLPGYGSTLYGSGAFGGTLNVVTREPADRDGGRLAFTGGGDGTWAARGSLDLAAHGADGGRTRLSLGRFGTDGHFESTADGGEAWAGADARATTATCRTTDRWGGWDVDAFAGLADRAFGARDFYAPFPSFEATRTFLGWARARGSLGHGIAIEPRVSVRTRASPKGR